MSDAILVLNAGSSSLKHMSAAHQSSRRLCGSRFGEHLQWR